MKLFSRISFFAFSLLFLLAALYMTYMGLEHVREVQKGTKTSAVITEIWDLKIGKGVYLAQIEPSGEIDTVYSKDFYKPYDIGTQISIYQSPKGNFLFQWNNIHLFIGFILIPFSIGLMFLASAIFLPDPETKAVSRFSRICFYSFFMIIGLCLVDLGRYGSVHNKLYKENSVNALATIVGYESEECQTEDDKAYTCYARILRIKDQSCTDHFVTEAPKRTKSGAVDSDIEIFHLKGNPKEYKKGTIETDGSRPVFILTFIGMAIFLLAFWANSKNVTVYINKDN